MKRLLENQKLRLGIELFFLLFFIFIAFQGRIQLWLAFLIVGIFFSLFWGRVFCGWFCPMATIFRGINWIYNKLNINRSLGPKIFKKAWIRWILLPLLISLMIFSRQTGREINPILYIFALSILITLFFQEPFWHRYLCPFGAPLSVAGKNSRNKLIIEEKSCTGCGLCEKVCPGQAICLDAGPGKEIDWGECLMCLKCEEICPVNAVNWN